MAKLTKRAALDAGNVLDTAADMITANAEMCGIKPDIAQKFAHQCDLLADYIAKQAGIDVAKLASRRMQALTGDDVFDEGAHGEDPEEIGEEKSGPKEGDPDESYMRDEFTQQENRELRNKQEKGDLASGSDKPAKPNPGVQASLDTGKKLASLYLDLNSAATKLASSDSGEVKSLGDKLAAAGLGVLQFQSRVLEGSEPEYRVESLVRAASHVLPHVKGDVSSEAAQKLARMTDIFTGLINPSA